MKLMFGIEYYYHDQYGYDQSIYPVVFTSRKKAEEYIKNQAFSSYLRIKTFKVDPE